MREPNSVKAMFPKQTLMDYRKVFMVALVVGMFIQHFQHSSRVYIDLNILASRWALSHSC